MAALADTGLGESFKRGFVALIAVGKHGRGLSPAIWIAIVVIIWLTAILIAVMIGKSLTTGRIEQAQTRMEGQARELKLLQRQNRFLSGEIKHLKETSQTLNQIKEKVFQINQRRLTMVKWAALPNRGGNWINRIDSYLARTPLNGQGRTFYLAAVDAGIEPRLMPAIAMVESGGGRANANTNNFFGRKAAGGGWAGWPTKEIAIQNQAHYISKMWGRTSSPFEMKGYATSTTWKAKVAGQMARI